MTFIYLILSIWLRQSKCKYFTIQTKLTNIVTQHVNNILPIFWIGAPDPAVGGARVAPSPALCAQLRRKLARGRQLEEAASLANFVGKKLGLNEEDTPPRSAPPPRPASPTAPPSEASQALRDGPLSESCQLPAKLG